MTGLWNVTLTVKNKNIWSVLPYSVSYPGSKAVLIMRIELHKTALNITSSRLWHFLWAQSEAPLRDVVFDAAFIQCILLQWEMILMPTSKRYRHRGVDVDSMLFRYRVPHWVCELSAVPCSSPCYLGSLYRYIAEFLFCTKCKYLRAQNI